MKRIILILFSSFFIMNCSNPTSLDLSKIDFNKNANEYLNNLKFYSKENQKGHFEVKTNSENVSLDLVDNGEKIVKYIFTEEENTKQLNYDGLEINSVLGANITVYNDKIAFISVHVNVKNSIELIEKLKKKLGLETEVIFDQRLKSTFGKDVLTNLSKVSANYIKYQKDDLDNDIVSFSQYIIWVKNDFIYQLTIDPIDNVINNKLIVISKKALKDRVILGFHSVNNDPILKKYMN